MTFSLRTNWSLHQWQEMLRDRYGRVNRERKPLETFARMTEMATGISRGVREEDRNVLKKSVPRFLAWQIGFANQLGVDLEEAVYNSYPGVCAYCRLPEGCTCRIQGRTQPRLSDPAEIKVFQKRYACPPNLVEWVAMFTRIYKSINKETGSVKMIGHFMEELGEVCEITRFHLATDSDLAQWKVTLTREQIELLLRQELADLFAWYCGLAHAMGVEIDADMKDIYQAYCPECGQAVCTCSPYRVHTQLRLGAKQ